MAGKTTAGGTYTHKNPACPCTPCSARRRKAEALLESAGAGGPDLAPKTSPRTTGSQINADFPLLARGRTAKDYVVQWLNLRLTEPGITNPEAAERIGISGRQLRAVLNRGTREGWLKFEEPIARLEHEIIPKAIDNLAELLQAKDRLATLETLKGTSFPAYRESRGISDAPQNILALKIETVDPTTVKVVQGTVVGSPKVLQERDDAI